MEKEHKKFHTVTKANMEKKGKKCKKNTEEKYFQI